MPNRDQSTLQLFRSLFKGHYRILMVSIMGSIGLVLLVYPVIYLVRKIFDDAIPHRDAGELLLLGCVLVSLILVQGGLNLWSKYTVLKAIKRAIQQFRSELLRKLFELPHAFYTDAERGKLHSIITRDTDHVDIMINAIASALLPTIVTGALLLFILSYLNWRLTLCVIVLIPLIWWLSTVAARMVKMQSRISQDAFSRFNRGVLFLLQMITLTRVQSAEGVELEKQEKYVRDLNEISSRLAWLNSLFRVIHETSVSFVAIVVLVVGGWMVLHSTLTVGELMAFYFVLGSLRGNLSGIATTIPQIAAGKVSMAEIVNLLAQNDPRAYGGTLRPSFDGSITMDSVYFRFNDKLLLEGATLKLRPGNITALVGSNGAGKSTIINLILGLYAPDSGLMLAGSNSYAEIDIKHLRQSIGVVMQDSPLFRGSIIENITYGSPDVRLEDVVAVTRLAAADEFIRKQAHGYETIVGEDGTLLSGGERQRLSIARALLRRPKLLILDQLDDHLDRESLQTVLDNIQALDYAPACLLISHDTSVERVADEVYLLKDKRLTLAREQIAELHIEERQS